jgi:5-methylcytosine-specific restriction enzyme A
LSRTEFNRKTRDAIIARAAGKCEKCAAPIKGRAFEIDHKHMAIYGGAATLENGELLCKPCHAAKTANDIKGLRKADRQRSVHIGSKTPTKRPIASAGFPARKKAEPKPSLPPRALFWKPGGLSPSRVLRGEEDP